MFPAAFSRWSTALLCLTAAALAACSPTPPDHPAANSATASSAPPAPPHGSGPPATRSPAAARASGAAGCPVFPGDNVWHADVSHLPVHRRSAAIIDSVGAQRRVHADFGSGLWEGAPIGIPVTDVPAGQPKVPVRFRYAEESDPGPYPVPRDAKIEGGPNSDGDRHIILLDRVACRAYELFAAYPDGSGRWRADSGAVFDLRSNRLRPAGDTSADASGLSILAGLVRYEEVAAGRVNHAIRVTVPATRAGYTWPATHSASSATDANLPQMGQRLRLRSTVSTAGLPRQARVVAEAMKRYGLIVADHGSAWYLSGEPDPRWDNDALRALADLTGDDFEVVDAAPLVISPTSGAVAGR